MPARILLLFLYLLAAAVPAADQVLIIEQDYNIVEQGKDGPQAKDIRQKLYISPTMTTIDEYGGKDNKPTETIVLDFKNKKIINLNHTDKKKVTEDFDARRARMAKRKQQAQEDRDAQPPGPQKDRLEKLYRAMLDDKRRFALAPDAGAAKTLLGVSCQPVKVVAEGEPGYAPFEACLHPDLEIPYDNADMLYLLQIIGEKMAEFLRKHKETFKKVPMELHLDLAAGGKLDTKVISIARTEHVDPNARGSLGSPFVIPEDYEERQSRRPVPKKDTRPD